MTSPIATNQRCAGVIAGFSKIRITRSNGNDHSKYARRGLRGLLSNPVPRGHMADLMAQYPRQFFFAIKVCHNAARNVDISAGQCKRIHIRGIQHGKREAQIRTMALRCKILANPVYHGLNLRVFVLSILLENINMAFTPQFNFLFLSHQNNILPTRHRVRRAPG